MLYTAHELGYQMMAPARMVAGFGAQFWRSPLNPWASSWLGRTSAADSTFLKMLPGAIQSRNGA